MLPGATSNDPSDAPPPPTWGSRLKGWPLWLLVLIPVVALFTLLDTYAINAPFLDDFMSVQLLAKSKHGALTLHDFFAAQMEHRIAWPRVVILALRRLWPSHFFLAQIWYSFTLLCLTLINVALLLRRTLGGTIRLTWPLLFLASLTLFSPVQFNILLWPFMHQVVTLGFFLTAGILFWLTRWPVWLRFILALLCALLATLSFTSGILIWMMLLPVILWSAPLQKWSHRFGWAGLWLVMMALTLGLYFHNLKNEVDAVFTLGQENEVPMSEKLHDMMENPWKAACYAARLLGCPLMRGNDMDLMDSALYMGMFLLALYALCLLWCLWRFKDAALRARLMPWLVMGAYSIGSACAITLGRFWIGLSGAYALAPRYVIHAVPLLISLPVVIWLIAEDLRSRRPGLAPALGRFLTGAGVAMVMLDLASWSFGSQMMGVWSSSRKRGAASTLFYKTNVKVENDYPDRPDLAKPADDMGLLRPPMVKNSRLDNFHMMHTPMNDNQAQWTGLHLETTPDGVVAHAEGYAEHKAHERVADGIFLCYQEKDGHWEIFHATNVLGLPLFVAGHFLRDLEFNHSPVGNLADSLRTFQAKFNVSELPKGAWKLMACAYDYDSNRVSIIPGTFLIDTEQGKVTHLEDEVRKPHEQ